MPDLMLWTRRAVNRPSMVYVSSADQLRVVAYGTHATNTLNVKARILDINGNLVYTSAVVPSGYFASGDVSYVPLIEGTLLSAVVSCNAADVHPGQQFVQMAIVRGQGALSIPNADNLVQGYTDTLSVLAWPEGTIWRCDEGPGNSYVPIASNPAPGTETSEIVHASVLRAIRSASFLLTTDATVGNRTVRFTIQDPSGLVYVRAAAPSDQPPSTTYRYNITPGVPSQALAGAVVGIGVPAGLRMAALSTYGTSTLNLAGGDVFTAIRALVDEWIAL